MTSELAPARRAGRPAGQDGAARMDIMRAAASRFSEVGYAGTSTRDILHAAGIGAPSLYHHFGSKAGVYIAVAAAAHEHVLELFDEAVEAAGQDYGERLAAVLRAVVALREEHPRVARFLSVVSSDVAQYDELEPAVKSQQTLQRFWLDTFGDDARGLAARSVVEGLLRLEAPASMLPLVAEQLGALARHSP